MSEHPTAAPYQPPRPARDIPHLLVPEKQKISHWNDRNEIRVNNWIEPWDFASPLDVGIINVPFSKTSILPNGAYAAPNALRDAWAIFTTFTPDYDVDMSTMKVRDIGDVSTPIIDIVQGLANIQEALQSVMSQPEGFFPLIIGGDHAITAPAVRAYCGAHPDQQVGLIHFDAHNDVRVMDHGPTNGTPDPRHPGVRGPRPRLQPRPGRDPRLHERLVLQALGGGAGRHHLHGAGHPQGGHRGGDPGHPGDRRQRDRCHLRDGRHRRA